MPPQKACWNGSFILHIVGFAGVLAALVTWWVQNFAAKRGFLVRFMFAFFVFVVAFCSFGGLLRFIYIHAAYPSQQDWSLTGMYLASLNDFYTFILDMFLPPRQPMPRSRASQRVESVFGGVPKQTVDVLPVIHHQTQRTSCPACPFSGAKRT